MSVYQIVDGKSYVNGIEYPIENIPEDKIEERLIDMKSQVEQAQKGFQSGSQETPKMNLQSIKTSSIQQVPE